MTVKIDEEALQRLEKFARDVSFLDGAFVEAPKLRRSGCNEDDHMHMRAGGAKFCQECGRALLRGGR